MESTVLEISFLLYDLLFCVSLDIPAEVGQPIQQATVINHGDYDHDTVSRPLLVACYIYDGLPSSAAFLALGLLSGVSFCIFFMQRLLPSVDPWSSPIRMNQNCSFGLRPYTRFADDHCDCYP